MLVIPQILQSVKDDRVHRYATCWKIDRKDTVTFRFTDHDHKLTVQGGTYVPTGGVDSSAAQKRDSLRGQDKEFRGAITSAAITTEDLREGRYRGAQITELLVDWRYPWAGVFSTSTYFLLETKFNGEVWEAQLGGLTSLLAKQVGEIYTRNCTADLGDARCKVALGPFTVTPVTVSAVVDRRNFTGTAAGLNGSGTNIFQFGEVTWLTGANAGLVSEIRASSVSTVNDVDFELQVGTVLDIQNGDTCTVIQGCDKTFATCIAKFANQVNYVGFPTIPGQDKLLQTPDR